MTFLEAAMALLKHHRKPLHFKKLAELAAKQDLLDHVGRAPEQAMQTALANAIRKGHPDLLIRVSPGVFGLRYYPPPGTSELPGPSPVNGASSPEPRETKEPARRGRGRKRKETPAETPVAPDQPATPAAPLDVTTMETKPIGPPASVAEAARAASQAAPPEGDSMEEEDEAEETPPSPGASAPGMMGAAAAPTGSPDERRRRRRRRRRGRGLEGGPEGARPEGWQPQGQRPPMPGGPGGRPPEPAHAAQAPAHAQPNRAPEPHRRPEHHPGQGRPEMQGHRRQERREPVRPAVPVAPSHSESSLRLADAAYEVMRQHNEGRPIHVRQLCDMALKRRLISQDGAEVWRALRAALHQDARERLGLGLRPRIRFVGGAQYTAADRRVENDLLATERQLAEQAEAMRKATQNAIAKRVVRLPTPAYEILARLLLERLGYRGLEMVKRTGEALYLGCARPRGYEEIRTLVAIRPGADQGRRAVGELRAGVLAKGFSDGLLVAAGTLSPEAISEAAAAGPPVELWGGSEVAAHLVAQGIGVLHANIPIDYVDADFFVDLQEA